MTAREDLAGDPAEKRPPIATRAVAPTPRRLSRKALATLAGVSALGVAAALGYSLTASHRTQAPQETVSVERRNTDALAKISTEITAAIRDDRAEAIVLGCAGMADLAAELSAAHGLPVVDGVAAAVTLAEGLVRLGLTTSRLGPYAAPRSKTYSGPFAPFQP